MPRGNKKYQASIRMPESMWNDIVEASARSSISAMEYMRRAIQKELDRDKDRDKKGGEGASVMEEQARSLMRKEMEDVGVRLNAHMEEALEKLRKENSLEMEHLRKLIEEQQGVIRNLRGMIQKEE